MTRKPCGTSVPSSSPAEPWCWQGSASRPRKIIGLLAEVFELAKVEGGGVTYADEKITDVDRDRLAVLDVQRRTPVADRVAVLDVVVDQ